MKVLIVDDSAVMRRVLKGAMAQCGITDVDESSDGSLGVSAASESNYDIILMDWNMPTMLGIDAVRAIRAMGKTVPIIMVTTEAEKSRIVEAIQAGASNYIIKPFDSKTILAKIKETIAVAAAK